MRSHDSHRNFYIHLKIYECPFHLVNATNDFFDYANYIKTTIIAVPFFPGNVGFYRFLGSYLEVLSWYESVRCMVSE